MVEIKKGMSQSQSQLFAIGAAVLAEVKAKKTRAEIQAGNKDLFIEYYKGLTEKTLTALSAAILADGQSDPKWKTDKATGKKVGYQKAMDAGSVGAAGYNTFRSWCAKWYTEQLVELTPEDLKKEREEKARRAAPPVAPTPVTPAVMEDGVADNIAETVKVAAETINSLGAVSTSDLIRELQERGKSGDPEALAVLTRLN